MNPIDQRSEPETEMTTSRSVENTQYSGGPDLVSKIKQFLRAEQAAGLSLFVFAILALILSNSYWAPQYLQFWHSDLTFGIGEFSKTKSLLGWINEGLIALFFFYISLEIKRELVDGELTNPKVAALPIAGAIGGILMPIFIYLAFTAGTPNVVGWGIPMATDIAFALGALSLVGKRIPLALKIFLTSLALIDDIGAIFVVASLSFNDINWSGFIYVGAVLLALVGLNRINARNPFGYCALGILLWTAFVYSEVHATMAGVLLALTIPFSGVDPARGPSSPTETPLIWLEHHIQPWIVFLVMPIFALANGTLPIPPEFLSSLSEPVVLGLLCGRIVGKVLGIFLFVWLAVKLKFGVLSEQLTWKHIHGASWLGGIGFTMSLYIGSLVFTDNHTMNLAKEGILISSIFSGLVGIALLHNSTRSPA